MSALRLVRRAPLRQRGRSPRRNAEELQTHVGRVVTLAPRAVQVTRSLAEADAAAERAAERRRAGLDAVLASLQAAKKVNVLDKSRADWSTFKQANTEARAARCRAPAAAARPAPEACKTVMTSTVWCWSPRMLLA